MPTPKNQTSKAVLFLLAVSLCASGAFAQGGAGAKVLANSILRGDFAGQINVSDFLEAPVAAPEGRAVPPASVIADPNAKDDDGTTALMRAARDGQNETVKAILALPGVRVDEKDTIGRTALMMAAIQGRTEAIRILLDAKADPKTADKDGDTALIIAATFGNTKSVQALLDGGADANQTNQKGESALHASLLGGRVETVAALASAPGADLNLKNKAGSTPALLAARLDLDSDKLAVLLDRGADKDLAGDYSDYGQTVQDYTPLMVATANGNAAGVKVLLDRKANLDYADKAGKRTALMIAIGAGNADIAKTLVDGGAKLNKKDSAGNTALLTAIAQGRSDIATSIASAAGADLNAANDAGTTALVEAARHSSDADLIKTLIDRGADKDLPGNYSDYSNTVKGYTPLMVAALNGNFFDVQALLDKKADVNYRAADGKTALDAANSAPMSNAGIINLLHRAGAKE